MKRKHQNSGPGEP